MDKEDLFFIERITRQDSASLVYLGWGILGNGRNILTRKISLTNGVLYPERKKITAKTA